MNANLEKWLDENTILESDYRDARWHLDRYGEQVIIADNYGCPHDAALDEYKED